MSRINNGYIGKNQQTATAYRNINNIFKYCIVINNFYTFVILSLCNKTDSYAKSNEQHAPSRSVAVGQQILISQYEMLRKLSGMLLILIQHAVQLRHKERQFHYWAESCWYAQQLMKDAGSIPSSESKLNQTSAWINNALIKALKTNRALNTTWAIKPQSKRCLDVLI